MNAKAERRQVETNEEVEDMMKERGRRRRVEETAGT